MKKAEVKIGAALAAAIMNDPAAIKVPRYRRVFRGSMFSGTAIGRSKYKPHQNDREKARRVRQGMTQNDMNLNKGG